MLRQTSLITLPCVLSVVLLASCADKDEDPRRKEPCRKLHERNRKCVDALVKALHARMDKSVPADIKAKLAKPLALEITKNAFIGKCRELTRPKDDQSQATKKALLSCLRSSDCGAYARCLLQHMPQPRPAPKKPVEKKK